MTSNSRSDPHYDGPERRAHPRIPASSVPHLTARVAGGPSVRLLDLSKRGVHIESTLYMRPGCTVAVRFVVDNDSVTLTGAVVRSACAMLEPSGEVTYHTALAFTDELTLCGEELDAAIRAPGASPSPSSTPVEAATDYTMIVLDGRSGLPLRARTDAAW
jgi:hypothetical protein